MMTNKEKNAHSCSGCAECDKKCPKEKINENDEGKLATAIYIKDNHIMIDFGKNLSWVALCVDEAEQFSATVLGKMTALLDLKDEAHKKLCIDIQEVNILTHRGEFHDFANTRYATPKIELVRKLEEIIKKVKAGKYDN